MTDNRENTAANDKRHFAEHLEQASQIVRSWPAWKRGVLGTVEVRQHMVLDEKKQLDYRIGRLKLFIDSIQFADLPSDEARLLNQQYEVMREYSEILESRIDRFDERG